MRAFAEKPESVSRGAKPACVRPKLKVSRAGDAHKSAAGADKRLHLGIGVEFGPSRP